MEKNGFGLRVPSHEKHSRQYAVSSKQCLGKKLRVTGFGSHVNCFGLEVRGCRLDV